MKKIITILVAILFSMSFMMTTACSEKTDYTVGIVQLVEHTALGAANKGFREELTKLMEEEGKTIKFHNKTASGDQATCTTIANVLVSKKVDLILAIATPAAQAVAAVTETIPVLFTAVTDAEDVGLVKSNENPTYNLSGTSDLNPVDQQIELIKELVPEAKKIAVIYNTAERNSEIQVELAKTACTRLGLELEEEGLVDISDIQTTFSLLDSDIDAIYIPTDNLMAKAAITVHNINKDDKKIPIVCGEIGMNDLCGVATYGIDYYILGQQTARMAFDVLVNGKDISTMPVEYQEKIVFSVNTLIASEIGFTIPQEILDRAKEE